MGSQVIDVKLLFIEALVSFLFGYTVIIGEKLDEYRKLEEEN